MQTRKHPHSSKRKTKSKSRSKRRKVGVAATLGRMTSKKKGPSTREQIKAFKEEQRKEREKREKKAMKIHPKKKKPLEPGFGGRSDKTAKPIPMASLSKLSKVALEPVPSEPKVRGAVSGPEGPPSSGKTKLQTLIQREKEIGPEKPYKYKQLPGAPRVRKIEHSTLKKPSELAKTGETKRRKWKGKKYVGGAIPGKIPEKGGKAKVSDEYDDMLDDQYYKYNDYDYGQYDIYNDDYADYGVGYSVNVAADYDNFVPQQGKYPFINGYKDEGVNTEMILLGVIGLGLICFIVCVVGFICVGLSCFAMKKIKKQLKPENGAYIDVNQHDDQSVV